jgi:Na+/phosphate symporter
MALAGAAIYVFAANSHLKEIGRLLCAAGLFALAFSLAGRTFAL